MDLIKELNKNNEEKQDEEEQPILMFFNPIIESNKIKYLVKVVKKNCIPYHLRNSLFYDITEMKYYFSDGDGCSSYIENKAEMIKLILEAEQLSLQQKIRFYKKSLEDVDQLLYGWRNV